MDGSISAYIHEFSTGILFKGRLNDWKFLDFTDQYINQTLSIIPLPVEQAIAEQAFSVGAGRKYDRPSVVGRVVGPATDLWSVVAVVTSHPTEADHWVSLYRYFLCQGESLSVLLSWMRQYEHRHHRLPVFNPGEVQQINQPHQVEDARLISRDGDDLPQDLDYLTQTPWVSSSQHPLTIEAVNQIATEKAQHNHQAIAWAFDVEGLAKPQMFQVIQPATESAEQGLRHTLLTLES